MNFDGLTLMAAGTFVSVVGCVLLLGAWWQLKREPTILLWAIAYFINGLGVAVLAFGFVLADPLPIAIGGALVPIAAAVVWIGTRVFHHRSQPWLLVLLGVVAWLAAPLLPFGVDAAAASTSATMGLAALWYAAAAVELWRGRRERLAARWPLIGVITLHAAIFGGGVIDVLSGNVKPDQVPPLNSWFSLIHFEQMLFLLGSAVFIVMMCRERREAIYIAAARIDSLTGVANRGSFFERAERLLRRCHEGGSSCALVVFDLDHFKQINDTWGHATGDQVLRTFADTARSVLRPNDLLGRHGGEEFAVLLPGVTSPAAFVIADRIRQSFAAGTQGLHEAAINATVSAGVATAPLGSSLNAALELADRALYSAKRLGRNRVERAEEGTSDGGESNVIRVA